jgi:hypothetical protein
VVEEGEDSTGGNIKSTFILNLPFHYKLQISLKQLKLF